MGDTLNFDDLNSRYMSSDDDINGTLLKNILYCFHYFDVNDNGQVDLEFVKEYIEELEYTNPELYQILLYAIDIISQCSTNTIAKEHFIAHLYTYVINPENSNDVNSLLLSSENPITRYYKRLEDNIKVIQDDPEYLSECTFTPKINKYRGKGTGTKLYKKEVSELRDFANKNIARDNLVTEYVVFHFNNHLEDWEHTLRDVTRIC